MTRDEIIDALLDDNFSVAADSPEDRIVVPSVQASDMYLESKRLRRTLEDNGLSVSPKAIKIGVTYDVHDQRGDITITGF